MISAAEFRIGAIANLDEDAQLDVLTIDELGQIEILSDDIGKKK